MKSKKRIFLVVIIIIIALLSIKMCERSNSFNNANSHAFIDKNMYDLEKLISEDDLCDDKWALKIQKLGKK